MQTQGRGAAGSRDPGSAHGPPRWIHGVKDFLPHLYCIYFTPRSRIVRIGACFVRVLCMHCIICVYFALIGRVQGGGMGKNYF